MTRVAMLGLVALIATILIIVLVGIRTYQTRSPGDPGSTDNGDDANNLSEEFPAASLSVKWADHHDKGRAATITLKKTGPALKLSETTLDLSPELPNQPHSPFVWEHTSREDGTIVLEATTTLDETITLHITWVFSPGDPQITLLTSLENASLDTLRKPLVLTFSLPDTSRFESLSSNLNFEPLPSSGATTSSWTPGWLIAHFSQGDESLSLSEWNFTSLAIAPDRPRQLSITLLDPVTLPSFQECADDKVTIRQQMTWTIGARLPLVPSRYASGYRAALAPLFLDPASHPSPYKDGRATNAQDWESRSKTLLYGHSLDEDPRFGNGGILGLGLGADLAMEQPWQDSAPIKALDAQLEQSKARQLTRTIAPQGSASRGLLLTTPHCQAFLRPEEPYLTLGATRQPSQLNILDHPPTLRINDEESPLPLPPLLPRHSTHLEVPLLSGQRRILTDAIFSMAALSDLINRRGLALFATPLIATRNPLSKSANHALLDPERQGQWTLSEPFARALANVELINERHNLLVTSPTLLLRHWQQARQVRLFELPDGSIAIVNPLEEAVPQFTLIAPGNLSPSIVEPAQELLGQEVVTTSSGTSQTWLWFELAPGTTRILLEENASPSQLSAIDWELVTE